MTVNIQMKLTITKLEHATGAAITVVQEFQMEVGDKNIQLKIKVYWWERFNAKETCDVNLVASL